MTDSSKSNRRWFHLTPDRFLVGLLVVVGVLFLSERFVWFPFNEQKGYTVLTAVVTVGVAAVLMLLWCAIALLRRRRFQFSIRSLLVLVTACAVVSWWFTVKWEQATRQRDAVVALEKVGGRVWYGYEVDDGSSTWKEEPIAPAWAVKRMGIDFFEDVDVLAVFPGGEFGDQDARHLRALTNIKQVAIRDSQMGDAGVRNLGELSSLKILALCNLPMTDAGLVHLKQLPHLEEIYLEGTLITDEGLAHVKEMSALKVLNLRNTAINDNGMLHLKEMRALHTLDLTDTQVTDTGLACVKNMTVLKLLGLSRTRITDAGLVHLVGLRNMEFLWLDHTPITDAGLEHLKGMTALRQLFLGQTQITDDGLRHLADLRDIRVLDLHGTQVTAQGAEELNKVLPDTPILFPSKRGR